MDFDVSNKYIVFGASSGGIYVYKRSPCNLIKFIPSMVTFSIFIKLYSFEILILGGFYIKCKDIPR